MTARTPLILDRAFNPRGIAIVGASANRTKWSNILFRRLINGRYRGNVVAVNPTRDQIEGRPCYPSMAVAPSDIDYAQILVPRQQVVQVVRDCAARGVPVVHVLSSGFGEVGGPGPALQAELVAALKGSRTALIGPNSLGLYCARSGLDFSKGCHFDPGPVTFISQSGALCTDVLALGQARGLKFSKILSVGNCCDLDWPDYVRYCRHDVDTAIAAFYIESVSDGRALFEELRALAKVKPVLLLKGGRTERGGRAVMSHTGRLAGDYQVWQAMMRQAGVIEIEGIEDLLLTLQAADFARAAPTGIGPGGARGGLMVIGSGGGISVLIADAAEASGLHLADLAPATLAELERAVPDAAELGGVGNPTELPVDRMFDDPDTMTRLIERAAGDPAVRQVFVHTNLIALVNQYGDAGDEKWEPIWAALAAVARRIGKPIVFVLRNGDCGALTENLFRLAMRRLRNDLGLVVFGDILSAVAFLRRVRHMGRH